MSNCDADNDNVLPSYVGVFFLRTLEYFHETFLKCDERKEAAANAMWDKQKKES